MNIKMRSSHPISRRTLCGAVLIPLLGCASSRRSSPDGASHERREYRGPLVDPREIAGDFMWQQRVSARHSERRGAFDAVLQKRGDELLVLGLTPMNTRGFSLLQKGTTIEYKQFVPFELPFSPSSVLYDIHRAFFYNLLEPFQAEGTRVCAFENEKITDQFALGHLVKRRFENVSDSGDELIIEYASPGYAKQTPPRVTTIDNRAYGYHLRVETTSVVPL